MLELTTRLLAVLDNPIEPQFGALPERPTEIMRMYCDATRARERLGWKPRTTLEDGLAQTIEWYRHELAAGRSSFSF